MTNRRRVSTGTIWEGRVGYSRAIEVGGAGGAGNMIAVAGTVAADEQGNILHPGSAYQQACFILRRIEAALKELDASLADVIRTRIYIINMNHQEEVGRAHAEAFADIRPACTMVGVKELADPHALVEIEADAVKN
ncbi:MAG: RidA family protein [Phycisphaeraceae bacterium]|nr:RidA family protein [Phycisphaerales bacterium]MCB9842873.1 RidA family protein [Phycisphaeraceae bacterium]